MDLFRLEEQGRAQLKVERVRRKEVEREVDATWNGLQRARQEHASWDAKMRAEIKENQLRTKELERSLANRESALRSIYATRAPLTAASPYASHYGLANVGMADDLRAEEAFLDQRRALYGDLRSAEANEIASAEARLSDERQCEQKLVDEREQARRAATAEAIEARAAEERRLREAEFKAAEARLADAKAALDRAVAAEERATQARTAEVSAAEQRAIEARASEEQLAKARVDEDKAFQDRRCVEEAAYARSLAFGGYYGYAPAHARYAL
jgi:hypothetical protein